MQLVTSGEDKVPVFYLISLELQMWFQVEHNVEDIDCCIIIIDQLSERISTTIGTRSFEYNNRNGLNSMCFIIPWTMDGHVQFDSWRSKGQDKLIWICAFIWNNRVLFVVGVIMVLMLVRTQNKWNMKCIFVGDEQKLTNNSILSAYSHFNTQNKDCDR